jgi:hypothetical protein
MKGIHQDMSKPFAMRYASIAVFFALSGVLAAQAKSEAAAGNDTGFTSNVEFDGTSNSAGQAYELDSSVGYTFTKHFGMDFGLPVYLLNGSSSTTGTTSGSGIGNPSVDLRWKFPGYATVLTGSAPWGAKSLGLNTGHATFDWNNHFDHAFNQVTPFFEAGFANTTPDSHLFVRPYTSYGFNTHFRGGAEVDVWKMISVGAAGYDIAPFGTQTLIPRGRPASPAAMSGKGKPHIPTQQTTGSASIAKDYGYSAWVDADLNRYMNAELGYTRSAQLDLNSISFSIGFNVGRLFRGSK